MDRCSSCRKLVSNIFTVEFGKIKLPSCFKCLELVARELQAMKIKEVSPVIDPIIGQFLRKYADGYNSIASLP